MAGGEKWSQFPSATALTGAELTALLQGGNNVTAPISKLTGVIAAQAYEAGVTVVNANYLPGVIDRYGTNGSPGTTDMTAALTAAATVAAAGGIPVTGIAEIYYVASSVTINAQVVLNVGSVLKPGASATIAINGPLSAPITKIFDASLGGTIAGAIRAQFFWPEWFGAVGDGKTGNSGYVDPTISGLRFIDPNAAFAATDVGKSILICPPLRTNPTQFPAFVGTIAAIVSPTAVTLNSAPTFTGKASFTASISSTTMTVPGAVTGTICPGAVITGASGGTTVVYQLTGTQGAGGGATYMVSISQALSSTALTSLLEGVYYYGTDDHAAIGAANGLVGQLATIEGYTGGYNNIDLGRSLSFRPVMYLTSTQSVIGGTPGTTAVSWEGVGGRFFLVHLASGTSVDSVTVGSGGATSHCGIRNAILENGFAGQNLLSMLGFQAPFIDNVQLLRAGQDSLSFNPQLPSWIQQCSIKNLLSYYAGRHQIYANCGAGSFVNELEAIDLSMGGTSCRQSGGTGLYVDVVASDNMDSWTIENYKFSNNWNGDPNFQPLGSFLDVVAGTSMAYNGAFQILGLTLINGYAENPSTTPLGATVSAIKIGNYAYAQIHVRGGFGTFAWGQQCGVVDRDGGGYFNAIAASASQDILIIPEFYRYTGEFDIEINDGTHLSRRNFVIMGGSSSATISNTSLGSLDYPSAATFTVTASLDGGNNVHVTVNNTGAVPFSLIYVAQTRQGNTSSIYPS